MTYMVNYSNNEIDMKQYETIKTVYETFKDKWNITDNDIEYAINTIKLDNFYLPQEITNKDICLLYLYGKKIMHTKRKEIRQLEFIDLFSECDDYRINCKERLLNVVFSEEKPSQSKFKQSSEFHEFNIERYHSTPTMSSMIAPIVLHAMTRIKQDPLIMNSNRIVIDLSKYVRKHMNRSALERYIWDNKGVDSRLFLDDLIDDACFISCDAKNENVPRLFDMHGPALVTQFFVRKSFLNEYISIYMGRNDKDKFVIDDEYEYNGGEYYEYNGDEYYEYTNDNDENNNDNDENENTNDNDEEFIDYCVVTQHSMVLVGYKIVDGKVLYIIQNWWKCKPYVIMDADYLNSCGAIFNFLEKGTPKENFDMNGYTVAECCIDACEKINPETKQ